MTNYKSELLFLIFMFTCLTSFSQTVKTIDSLEAQYQACLDHGKFMRGCANTFYYQMDSLLNVQYKELRTKCDSFQKVNLKDDQLKWLAVRDRQFKLNRQLVHKEAKESGYDGGQTEAMTLTNKNAMFVRDRVIELMNTTPNDYSPGKYKSRTYRISTE